MINWHQIKTGSGTAEHIPNAIQRLNDSDPEVRFDAYWSVDNYVIVQSDLYEAAYYTIDLLVEFLEREDIFFYLEALRLLEQIAIGCGFDEVIKLQDEGDLEKGLEQACHDKLIRYKERIASIKVKDEYDIEKLESILELIQEFEEENQSKTTSST